MPEPVSQGNPLPESSPKEDEFCTSSRPTRLKNSVSSGLISSHHEDGRSGKFCGDCGGGFLDEKMREVSSLERLEAISDDSPSNGLFEPPCFRLFNPLSFWLNIISGVRVPTIVLVLCRGKVLLTWKSRRKWSSTLDINVAGW